MTRAIARATLFRKKKAYAWWKIPAKCFKICHILYIRKPKVAVSVFHFVLLYFFPLMNALVYVDRVQVNKIFFLQQLHNRQLAFWIRYVSQNIFDVLQDLATELNQVVPSNWLSELATNLGQTNWRSKKQNKIQVVLAWIGLFFGEKIPLFVDY